MGEFKFFFLSIFLNFFLKVFTKTHSTLVEMCELDIKSKVIFLTAVTMNEKIVLEDVRGH